MKSYLFTLDCITNLHVGSGDINFNIVDKEVEKDPVTRLPVIHASGLKGAIRDYCRAKFDDDTIKKVFGDKSTKDGGESGGLWKFTDAGLVYRMMRAAGNCAAVGVTTKEALEYYVETVKAFGLVSGWSPALESISFPEGTNFLCSRHGLRIEGENTGVIDNAEIKTILGADLYGIAQSMENYELPVIARNNRDPQSRNLWYEEFVPHGSRFWFILLAPDGEKVKETLNDTVIQFGGNASVGCGFCKLTVREEGEF